MKKKNSKTQDRSMPGGLVPDFECVGCGNGVYQAKEPVHCVKCGGTRFRKIEDIQAGDDFQKIVGTIMRARRELAAARVAMRKSGHRRRKKLVMDLEQVERGIDRVVRRMTTVPNPTRGEIQIDGSAGGKDATADQVDVMGELAEPKQEIQTKIEPASKLA